jgi:hypothetical protein
MARSILESMQRVLLVLLVLALAPAARSHDLAQGGLQLENQGGLISVDWKDAALTDALRLVARVGGVNLVLDPSAAGKTVTLALHDVPWEQALVLICQTNGFGAELDGNVLRVAPVSKLVHERDQLVQLREAQALSAPLATVAFPLSWTSAAAAEAIVRKQLSPRGSTMIDRRTNTLFVTDVLGSQALQGAFDPATTLAQGARFSTSELSVGLSGPVTSPIVAIRPADATPGPPAPGQRVFLPVGHRIELPGAPGLQVGLERDGSRLVLVARSGRLGAQVPGEDGQALELELASGSRVMLVADSSGL